MYDTKEIIGNAVNDVKNDTKLLNAKYVSYAKTLGAGPYIV